MKDDNRLWMKYAEENVKSAKVLKDNRLFNPCLQDIQQAVEKFLKAVIIEYGFEFKKNSQHHRIKGNYCIARNYCRYCTRRMPFPGFSLPSF